MQTIVERLREEIQIYQQHQEKNNEELARIEEEADEIKATLSDLAKKLGELECEESRIADDNNKLNEAIERAYKAMQELEQVPVLPLREPSTLPTTPFFDPVDSDGEVRTPFVSDYEQEPEQRPSKLCKRQHEQDEQDVPIVYISSESEGQEEKEKQPSTCSENEPEQEQRKRKREEDTDDEERVPTTPGGSPVRVEDSSDDERLPSIAYVYDGDVPENDDFEYPKVTVISPGGRKIRKGNFEFPLGFQSTVNYLSYNNRYGPEITYTSRVAIRHGKLWFIVQSSEYVWEANDATKVWTTVMRDLTKKKNLVVSGPRMMGLTSFE